MSSTLQFTRSEIEPGMTALAITGSIHCGPECGQLESEVDKLIEEKQTRVILDLTGVTTMDSAAIGAVVRCFRKFGLRAAGDCTQPGTDKSQQDRANVFDDGRSSPRFCPPVNQNKIQFRKLIFSEVEQGRAADCACLAG